MRSWKSISGIVFYMILFSFLADNFNYFFIRFVYPNSFIIGNSWYLLNYLLVALLFAQILDKKRKLFIGFLAVFIIGSIISFTFFFQFTESNVFVRLFSNVSFIFFALNIYLELLKSPNQKISRLPLFWIATALFVQNSLLLLQSIFNNYLIFDQKITTEAMRIIHIINLVANITKNFILFYAIVLIDKGYPDSLKPTKVS